MLALHRLSLRAIVTLSSHTENIDEFEGTCRISIYHIVVVVVPTLGSDAAVI